MQHGKSEQISSIKSNLIFRGGGEIVSSPTGRGTKLRPKESGGPWVEGSEPPPHQLGGWGIALSSPSGVRGGALENLKFGAT